MVPPLKDWPRALLALAVLFWSGNSIVGRAVHELVPPIALAYWRWTVAFLLLLPFVLGRLRRDRAAIRKHWRRLALLSALGVASFNTLLYAGLNRTDAVNALLIQSAMPVVIAALSAAAFRERIDRRRGAGILIALTGATAIITNGRLDTLAAGAINGGDALVATGVLCYASYSVLLRLRPAMHPLSFVAVTFLMGSLMLLPLCLWEAYAVRTPVPSATTVAAVCYVAVFPSIVSFLCFNRGVELLGASQAGLFLYLMPVFGSVMAIGLLGESLCWYHGLGLAGIAFGIWLSHSRARVLRGAPPPGPL